MRAHHGQSRSRSSAAIAGRAPSPLAVPVICLAAVLGPGLKSALAQDQDEPKLGWSNTTDLSLVFTEGNSSALTMGFSDTLRHVWPDSRVEIKGNVVRSSTSDDRYFLVEPGIEFVVGSPPTSPGTSLVKPEPSSDVATYRLGGRYDRNITEAFVWNTGGSWNRNDDAGILNRYIAFAGVGNVWADTDARHFATDYGVSYTDREEEKPDPEKDRRFAGARVGWDYTERFWDDDTAFDSDFTTNVNLEQVEDVSINTTQALTVSMNSHISLKVSLQLLFENQPALETDLDVIAYAELIDPDGIAGSGDERYRTTESGGIRLVLGSMDARKDKLDTIIRTALVLTF